MSKLRRNWIRMSSSRRSNRIKLDRIGSVRCGNALTVAECDVLEVWLRSCVRVCVCVCCALAIFLAASYGKKAAQ